MLRELFLVALGGALGATLRFLVSHWMPRQAFPWATLAVNLTGCLLAGVLVSRLDGPARTLFVVGLLGAFTTLSAYSIETHRLVQEAKHTLAALNIVANALGGPLLAALGWFLARR